MWLASGGSVPEGDSNRNRHLALLRAVAVVYALSMRALTVRWGWHSYFEGGSSSEKQPTFRGSMACALLFLHPALLLGKRVGPV